MENTSLLDLEEKPQKIKTRNRYQVKCLPMLKWAGGKRRLLKDLVPLMSSYEYNTYFEPFFGGGALFFATQPNTSVLSDTNEELINCYKFVRDYPTEVIDRVRQMNNTEEDYYLIRKSTPTKGLDKAARIIYLTTLSFNGIYRLNRKGEFNVPYGYKTHLIPGDEARIMAVSAALSNAQLFCQDFEETVRQAGAGDLVYFDPPYAISQGNGFVKYNSKVFTWEDQIRLSETAERLRLLGCNVIVSNADVQEIRDLYPNFKSKVLHISSVIAASGDHRKKITERIFYSEV